MYKVISHTRHLMHIGSFSYLIFIQKIADSNLARTTGE